MKRTMGFLFASLFLASFGTAALADHHGHLAKSGTISWVTGWIFEGPEPAPQADGYAIGHAQAVGATFNVNGSGPLHAGRATCVVTFIVTPDGATNKGNCFFGDQDGDRIFTSFTGDVAANKGINTIVGGTGKYAGITGSGPWECDASAPADTGGFNCRQSLAYELP